MSHMRAKLQVGSVIPNKNADGETVSERVVFHGVAKSSPYPADGSDDDNTFARWSPSVLLDIQIANPALFGTHTPGDKFYVDFTKVE